MTVTVANDEVFHQVIQMQHQVSVRLGAGETNIPRMTTNHIRYQILHMVPYSNHTRQTISAAVINECEVLNKEILH